METTLEAPVLQFASQQEWAAWLAEHFEEQTGVWLKIAKKSSGTTTVSHLEALEEALCFGWIDGLRRPCDQQYFLQKFTPRRPKSAWSKINTDKVEALLASGKMHPAGLREVEAAKLDGRWDAAYSSQKNMEIPEDLQSALDAAPVAREFFGKLNRLNQYSICYRITTAKKPETRRARIEKYIAMLAEGKRIHP